MKFPDALRGQLYLSSISRSRTDIHEVLLSNREHFINHENILDDICTQIARELDKIILPTFVKQFHLPVKRKGIILEKLDNYEDFFFENNQWSDEFSSIKINFANLFEYLDLIAKYITQNICNCIENYVKDIKAISSMLNVMHPQRVTGIHVSNSDRHRFGRQVIIVELEKEKVVYKPRGLVGEIAFKKLAQIVNQYKEIIFFPKFLDMGEYGWMEFIHPKAANNFKSASELFYNCGALLAFCDAFSFTDGHFENVIFSDSSPIIIDFETMFFNFSALESIKQEKTVLHTMLLQSPPEDGGIVLSAFQTGYSALSLHADPYPVNERTNSIEVRYIAKVYNSTSMLPIYDDTVHKVSEFSEYFINGFRDLINILREVGHSEIMSILNLECFEKKYRHIFRATLFYSTLIRRLEHPSTLDSKEYMSLYLNKLQYEYKSIIQNEITSLNRGDVPIFYQNPRSRFIYSESGDEIEEVFSSTSSEQISLHLSSLLSSDEQTNKSINIIKSVLKWS